MNDFLSCFIRWSPCRLPLLVLPLCACFAHAQTTWSSALDHFLQTQTQGLPGKVTYSHGQLDQHSRLAACSAYEPFLPAGSRLWGKTTVGVRCLAPTPWTAYVPVQVSIAGNYLVAFRQLLPGQKVEAGDVASQPGDLGALPVSVLTDPAQAIGKTVKIGVAAGQPVRAEWLAAPWVVQQGQSVRLISSGAGFTVSNEGKALNNAVDGQVTQVRTHSGQVVSGVARPGGIVQVSY